MNIENLNFHKSTVFHYKTVFIRGNEIKISLTLELTYKMVVVRKLISVKLIPMKLVMK